MMNARGLLDYISYPACLDYLADDVEWSLPLSLGDTYSGRPAVVAMLEDVMTRFYDPAKMSADVTASFGTDDFATLVFTMNATTRWGQTYSNQYSITIQAAHGKIVRVYELCDTQNLYNTMQLDTLSEDPSASRD
jgi:ketosteroid isomerase-like protein